jgi:hypothetical protein
MYFNIITHFQEKFQQKYRNERKHGRHSGMELSFVFVKRHALYGQKQRENNRHYTIQSEHLLFSKILNIFPKEFFSLFFSVCKLRTVMVRK